MKTICYVRSLSKKSSTAAQSAFSSCSFVEESRPGGNWEDSDLGEIIRELDEEHRLVVGDCSDLGKNILESLEILAAIWDSHAYFFVMSWAKKTSLRAGEVGTRWADIFLGLAQAEQTRRSERTKKALRKRKEAGLVLGRPPGKTGSLLDRYEKQIRTQLSAGVTQKFLAKKYNVSPSTLSQWMKRRGIRRDI